MANVTIQPVETRSQQKEFVGLPWKLYAQDPNWVPPLLQNHQELLGYQTALGRPFPKPPPGTWRATTGAPSAPAK